MGPVYASRIGLDIPQVSNFMASAILGAMLLAWPLGQLCDRFDRYRIMVAVSSVAAACSLAVVLLGSFNMPLLILFVGVYMGRQELDPRNPEFDSEPEPDKADTEPGK